MPWKRPNPDLQNDPTYLTPRLNELDAQLADIASVITLGGKNDGTVDISSIILDYAAGKDEVYVYLPAGIYRWDNTITLENKKISIRGDGATIHHYQNGNCLKIGNVLTKNTESFVLKGITFINKKPKLASGGTGVSAVWVLDCKNVLIDDFTSYDVEQFGINLRADDGNIDDAIINNVRVFRASSNISTTTPIALATRANGTNGRIKRLKVSNSYFEVTNTFIDDTGATQPVNLSNSCKIQGVDYFSCMNTDFVNGKENGTLSFIYDTKVVKLVNVNCISTDTLISNGITISGCPNLELEAVNCKLGIENFGQSIGINETVKSAKFSNSTLQRITVISGVPENFTFDNCEFVLKSNHLNISLKNSLFNNCRILNESSFKNIYLVGEGNRLVNFTGALIIEISGNSNTVLGGEYESLRPNGTSRDCYIKSVKVTSNARCFRNITDTTANYLVEDCTFIRTVGGGDSSIINPRGTNMQFVNNKVIQKDKTTAVSYVAYFTNSTNCTFIQRKNFTDVNIGTSSVGQTGSTGLKQYETGDVFYNAGVRQVWNGSAFENL